MNETEVRAKKLREIVEAVRKVTPWKGIKIVDNSGEKEVLVVSHDLIKYLMNLRPSEFKVWFYLRMLANEERHYDKDGDEIWSPDQNALALGVKMVVRTFQRALDGLKMAKLLETCRSGLAERGKGQNFYRLLRPNEALFSTAHDTGVTSTHDKNV